VPDVHEQCEITCNDIADVAVAQQYTAAPWSDAYVVCGSSRTIFHFDFGGGLEHPEDLFVYAR